MAKPGLTSLIAGSSMLLYYALCRLADISCQGVAYSGP